MKIRHVGRTVGIAGSIVSIFSIFWFLPATYERKVFSGARKVSYNGYPVREVGYSRLCQSGNADGRNSGGKCYGGRCYVEYLDGLKVRRTYGNWVWFCTHYEDVLSTTGQHVGFKVTETTIDLH